MLMSSFDALPNTPPPLTKICLDFVYKNFDDQLASQIPKLEKELKDKLWRFLVGEKMLTDARLPRFYDSVSAVKEIDLSGCEKLTDVSLIYLSKKFPSLQSINLSFCPLITPEGIKTLCTSCTQLNTLALYHSTINDAALIHVANFLPSSLKSLALGACFAITDTSILKLSSKCIDLTFLDISHCKALTSNAIKSICASLTNLQHLDVSWCSDSISDSSLQKITKCHKLQHLGLADAPKASDSVVQKLLQGCTKLISLDVSFCSNVFQADKIVKNLAGLQRLVAAGCNVNDATLGKILETAHELRELDISYNEVIKDQWIANFVQNPNWAKSLRVLNVSFCKGIPLKSIQALQQARENLTLYFVCAH